MKSDLLVVFDTDMGTDDAWALLLLLKAEAVLNLFAILAITTVQGNTNVTNATENCFRLLASAGRTNIPIHKGSPKALIPTNDKEAFYGLDGFGDILLSHPGYSGYISPGHAVDKMYELAIKFPNKISFVMVGPLTNLALCMTMYDDFLDNVKDIWILGGHLNETKYNTAEFNFRVDAVAAHIVLSNAKVPVHLLPLEPCVDANKEIDLNFRFTYLGSGKSPPIQLLNTVEAPIFEPKGIWEVFDPMLAAVFAFPNVTVESEDYYGYVEPCGSHAGVITLARSEDANIRVIKKLNRDYYRKIISWTAGVENINF